MTETKWDWLELFLTNTSVKGANFGGKGQQKMELCKWLLAIFIDRRGIWGPPLKLTSTALN